MSYFTDNAPWLMGALMRDFTLDELDAAAIVGNFGHESGGFESLQEIKPTVAGSRGGYGLPQWTGPRRRAYEAYCLRNNLDPSSLKANYKYIVVELRGGEKRAIEKVKAADTLPAKVKAFELAFERAGVKHYDSRNKWARRALDTYVAAHPIQYPAWLLAEWGEEVKPTEGETDVNYINIFTQVLGMVFGRGENAKAHASGWTALLGINGQEILSILTQGWQTGFQPLLEEMIQTGGWSISSYIIAFGLVWLTRNGNRTVSD